MRRTILSLLLAGTVMTTLSLPGQSARTSSQEVDVALTYGALRNDLVGGSSFWQQGGSLELSAEAYHGLGVAMSISGARVSNIQGRGVNLTTITDVFGPRYTWTTRRKKIALFGQGLIGEAHGIDSVFPSPQGTTTSFNSFALQVGSGVDLRLSRHFAIHPFQADWLRTQFPNASTNVQNDFRLGAGVVFRLQR